MGVVELETAYDKVKLIARRCKNCLFYHKAHDNWRICTNEEFYELIEPTYCDSFNFSPEFGCILFIKGENNYVE